MRELFPNDEHTSPRSMYRTLHPFPFQARRGRPDTFDSTDLLLMALKQVMSKITQERRSFEPLQVPLWLCGHSLGSALASLVYARLIRSPGDLPTQVELKDCYAFGSELSSASRRDSEGGEGRSSKLTRPHVQHLVSATLAFQQV